MRREYVITGHDAIDYAEKYGVELHKYADPTEDARSGLSVRDAILVAREDPSLIYAELRAADVAAKIRRSPDLDALFEAVQAADLLRRELEVLAANGDRDALPAAEELRAVLESTYCDLPAWGPEPDGGTLGVYSWDSERVLACDDRWALFPRSDWG